MMQRVSSLFTCFSSPTVSTNVDDHTNKVNDMGIFKRLFGSCLNPSYKKPKGTPAPEDQPKYKSSIVAGNSAVFATAKSSDPLVHLMSSLESTLKEVKAVIREAKENSESFSTVEESDIPTLDSLKSLLQDYVIKREGDNRLGPVTVPGLKSYIYMAENFHYLNLNLLIHKGSQEAEGIKDEITLGINLKTNELVAIGISKFDLNLAEKDKIKYIDPDIFKKLAVLKSSDGAGVLPLYDFINMTNRQGQPVAQIMMMKYCRQGNLHNLLNRILSKTHSVLTPAEKKDLVVKVTRSFAIIHAAGLVHRDGRIDNILLVFNEQTKLYDVYLADYDLASEEGAPYVKTAGSTAHLPPEVLTTGKSTNFGKKGDVWDVGIIIEYILTGKIPQIVAGIDAITDDFYPEERLKSFIPYNDQETEPMRKLLANKIFVMKPEDRISMQDLLQELENMPPEKMIL